MTGDCSNSCDVVCSALTSDGSEVCTDAGGGSTTCEAYGVYVHCGDGACAVTERCGCSSDCGLYCISGGIPGELVENLPREPTFNEPTTIGTCQQAVAANWAYGWDCPTWDWVNYMNESHPACAAKQAALAEIQTSINQLKAFADAIRTTFGCPSSQHELCALADAFDGAAAEGNVLHAAIQAQPCYVAVYQRGR